MQKTSIDDDSALEPTEKNKDIAMPLGKHEHTKRGGFRRERGDSLAGNLAKEYPEFEKVDPRTKLETLRDRFNVDSLNQVRKKLRG